MKMPQNEFEMLKSDFLAMVSALQVQQGPINYGTMCNAWAIYHRVMDDRSYDDSHPFYCGEKPRQRVLPYVNRRHNSKFYAMGLNDSHIETALRKIIAS